VSADFQLRSEWSGLEVFDMKNSGDETRGEVIDNFRGCCGGHGVAIHEGCEEAAVHEAGDRHVVRGWREMGDDGFPFNVALELMSGMVLISTAEAMSEVLGVEILDCRIR